MVLYSHSKLSTFEQCKLKYKLKYIDKIKPDFEATIEAHLGKCVHDSLEWLYENILKNKIPDLNSLIEHYTNKWQENYRETFKVVKEEFEPVHYFNKGVRFLVDYYTKHQPFQDGTLELEKKIILKLHKKLPYKIIGYIDRLSYNKEKNTYEIHDYKTGNFLPNQEKFDTDRQLALYGLAIKNSFGKDKNILLVWHYLDHNQKITSYRTEQEYEQLRQDTIKLIFEVEQTKHFYPQTSSLCSWCEFKSKCSSWNKNQVSNFV